MSTAALVNARASNGSTVQTEQLQQQQQQAFSSSSSSSNGRHSSTLLSTKKIDDAAITENGKTEKTASRSPSVQSLQVAGEPDKTTVVGPQDLLNLSSTGKDDGNKLYPDDLRNILIEVSRTGTSATLHWTEAATNAAPSSSFAPHQHQHHQHSDLLNGARRPLNSSGESASGPPRKKQRNGLHQSTSSRTGVKRPLSIRSGGVGGHQHHLSPAHSRTSGSEVEDMSQYDSEGTVSSEISMDRAKAQHLLNGVLNRFNQKQTSNGCRLLDETKRPAQPKYKSLREVFRIATGAVLNHFYEKQGGYKLSPAEKRRNFTLASSLNLKGIDGDSEQKTADDVIENGGIELAEAVFNQRKQRLLNVLSDPTDPKGSGHTSSIHVLGPPFTIQRVAEVLLTPERYYTQTHKLCNCLEKLLLVTSSIQAFGGSTGGNSSQSRREEQEIAALADERGRLLSEYRRRRIQRSMSEADGHGDLLDGKQAPSSPPKPKIWDGNVRASETGEREDDGVPGASKELIAKEELIEAARASLRSKFDHVGIDPHSAAANVNREHQAAGNRSMTNSPPPPHYSGAGHGHGGFVRHSHEEKQGTEGSSLVVRTTSPILFKPAAEGALSPKKASPTPVHPTHQNLQLLQMHHAAALAGVSPFDIMNLTRGGHAASAHSSSSEGTLSIESGNAIMPHIKEMNIENRSPASSDIDSESDDISFDDSASDRSDGSDSNEPAISTAARALALNRVQQQQQQYQPRRVLGSTTTSAFSSNISPRSPSQQQQQQPPTPQQSSEALPSVTATAAPGILPNTGGGRQTEAGYQSGDSVDSLRAEDSDSSSSDMAG